MPKATTRHILVETEEHCNELKQHIENAADFAQLAAEYSQCPSGSSGGDLGEFDQGKMAPEFDQIIFHDAVGEVPGPVATQFGCHLIEILSRSE